MKGEYVDQKDRHNMFAKLHHTQKFHHQFQFSGREFQTSDETHTGATNKELPITGDGSTIEILRRPRGRPPGSKNKPKQSAPVTGETDYSMSPHVLEFAGGVDIIDSIGRFCRNRNMGLCVLTGSGTVSNVTLKQPSKPPGSTMTFHGRFEILSLSATIMPSIPSLADGFGFRISLAGPQGRVIGGSVVGSLISAGTVYVTAASFNNPLYDQLPAEVEMGDSDSGEKNRGGSPPVEVSGGGGGGHPPAAAESGGLSMYSYHLPSDVIWAPTAKQLTPPPPY